VLIWAVRCQQQLLCFHSLPSHRANLLTYYRSVDIILIIRSHILFWNCQHYGWRFHRSCSIIQVCRWFHLMFFITWSKIGSSSDRWELCNLENLNSHTDTQTHARPACLPWIIRTQFAVNNLVTLSFDLLTPGLMHAHGLSCTLHHWSMSGCFLL